MNLFQLPIVGCSWLGLLCVLSHTFYVSYCPLEYNYMYILILKRGVLHESSYDAGRKLRICQWRLNVVFRKTKIKFVSVVSNYDNIKYWHNVGLNDDIFL